MSRTKQLARFSDENHGHFVSAPGGLGGQCVDLVTLWASQLGAARIWANAVDLFVVAPDSEWTKVRNTPSNYPAPGDIVVWGPTASLGIGADGHTAIALAADKDALLVLQQNYPTGSMVHLGGFAYAGVIGWLHRRG